MDIEHRKAEILAQLFQSNTLSLAANLAQAFAERDGLKARIAELEKELAALKAPPAAVQ